MTTFLILCYATFWLLAFATEAVRIREELVKIRKWLYKRGS